MRESQTYKYKRAGPRRPARGLLENALNRVYDGLVLQTGDDLIQMCQVPDLQIDSHLGEVGTTVHHLDVVYVAVRLTDEMRDLGQ